MKVEVRLFATLTEFLPPGSARGSASVDLPPGSTVGDLVRTLGIPPGLERVTLVNDREATPDRVLAPGDVVTVFPPLAGGWPRAG